MLRVIKHGFNTQCRLGVTLRYKSNPAVLEAKNGKPSASVIFLHGLGDTSDGWKEIAEMAQHSQPHVRWVLPEAPNQFVTINQCKMPSWYDIVSLEDRSCK